MKHGSPFVMENEKLAFLLLLTIHVGSNRVLLSVNSALRLCRFECNKVLVPEYSSNNKIEPQFGSVLHLSDKKCGVRCGTLDGNE
jgi:hypothetical protein